LSKALLRKFGPPDKAFAVNVSAAQFPDKPFQPLDLITFNTIAGVLAERFATDQPGLLENAEVLGNRRLRQRELTGQVAKYTISVKEQAQDLYAHRMPKCVAKEGRLTIE